MFLQGKKFPYGDLTAAQYKQHVYNIVHFVTTDEYLTQMLDFDSEEFFKIIGGLYKGMPW
jgi:hypothetical protein